MGFLPSGSTTSTVTINVKLTKKGREKLVYGSGTSIKYFTLHDEGVNYTSLIKPSRGSVAGVAGSSNSNIAVANGVGFKDTIFRQLPTDMVDAITQSGVKRVKAMPTTRGWGTEIGISADTSGYNKINLTVNLDYAMNFMYWMAQQVESGNQLDYSLFYETNNHPASSMRDGFLNFLEGVVIDTDDESTQITLDTQKDDIDVTFLSDSDRIITNSTTKYSSDLQKYILMSKELLYSNGGSPLNVSYVENGIDSPFKFAFSSSREINQYNESVNQLTNNPPESRQSGKLFGGSGKWGITLGMTDFVYGIRRRDWKNDNIRGSFDSGVIQGNGNISTKNTYFDLVGYSDGLPATNSDYDFIEVDPGEYEGLVLPTSTDNNASNVPLYVGVSIKTSKNKGFYPRSRVGSYPLSIPGLEMCSFGSQAIAVQNDIIESFFRRTSGSPYQLTDKDGSDNYRTSLTFIAKPRNIKSTRSNPVKGAEITVTFKYNKSVAEDRTIDWGLGQFTNNYNYNNFVVKERSDNTIEN
mgnify:CR=1 FL=1|tara:strand:- start:298 stop:1869 length:1572 start_codon:yes stop_codon:yes gene_type:complete